MKLKPPACEVRLRFFIFPASVNSQENTFWNMKMQLLWPPRPPSVYIPGWSKTKVWHIPTEVPVLRHSAMFVCINKSTGGLGIFGKQNLLKIRQKCGSDYALRFSFFWILSTHSRYILLGTEYLQNIKASRCNFFMTVFECITKKTFLG